MAKLRSPIPKRCTFSPKAPFPVNIFETNEYEEDPHYHGNFNGFNVTIGKREEMIALYTMGYFGKGSLSQGYPAFEEKRRKRIILEEHLKQQKNVQLIPEENLQLMLEEAFFLSFVLECLTVTDRNNVLNVDQMWKHFQNVQPFFIERYIAYHYYRSRGWVVKPGLKYGGDFLLYKQGPPFFHASAVVVVISNVNVKMADIEHNTLIAVNRAIEAARKELLIAEVFIPKDLNYHNVNDLSRCTISEFLFKRKFHVDS